MFGKVNLKVYGAPTPKESEYQIFHASYFTWSRILLDRFFKVQVGVVAIYHSFFLTFTFRSVKESNHYYLNE